MNPPSLRLALAQLNPTVGDVAGNAAKALAARARAQALGAELLMLPGLFLSGSPLQDLALKPAFQDACRKACEDLARATADGGPGILIGLPWRDGDALYNAYALLDGGVIQSVRFKAALAGSGVRDETRLFQPGPLPGPLVFRDKVRLGLAVGEDVWSEEVVECLAETGAELLLAATASPYHRGIGDARMNVAVARVVESGLPLAHLNQVGGQDELVFDGASFVLNGDRTLAHQLPAFREAITMTRWQREGGQWRCDPGERAAIETGDEADYATIVLGLRDYAEKTGASGAVLDLSGDVGSCLCAAIAVDALGPARVTCVSMPSRLAAADSDARACVHALGLRLETVPIAAPAASLEVALTNLLGAAVSSDTLQERLENRTRDAVLTALVESLGWLLVRSSNKSETSCGPSSRSGPTGGFSPLRDIYGTQARRLAELRNRWKPAGALGPDGEVVPRSVSMLWPAPDRHGLPLDENLDAILDLLVEQDMRVSEIIARGHDAGTVKTVERLVRHSESARRRAGPGIRIGARSVNGERRYPVANGFGDIGEPQHEPDTALVKGIGRPATESFDM